MPDYYEGKYKKIEAMDVVLDFSEDNYNIGTALTYLMRAGKKPNNPITQDIEKAIVHLQRELKHQTTNNVYETSNDLPNSLQEGRTTLPEPATSDKPYTFWEEPTIS
jgi:spermidine/putrescine-binding protein|tara:strand:- start:2510 stop:2830 length:321 start_codon:yes stop_codon:yes gene_type:complete